MIIFESHSIAMRIFCYNVMWQRIAMILITPYKIRNITMKNFIENASKNSRNNLVKNSVESQLLKWVSQGGGSM
jgi:hypothetical protein